MTVVPNFTYQVKKFATGSKDLIHTADLIDCVGVVMVDRSTKVAAVAHFHPISCFSKEVTKMSLEKIKKEFVEKGGDLSKTKVRVVGGNDLRLRELVGNACGESLPGCKITNEGLLNAASESTHAIITGDRSYIAKIHKYRQEAPGEKWDSSVIGPDKFKVVEAIGGESESLAQREETFFEKCQGTVRSQEQKMFKAKTLMVGKKLARDEIGLVPMDRTLWPKSPKEISINPEIYGTLVAQERATPIGASVAQARYKGSVLKSVDELVNIQAVANRGGR